MDFEGNSEESAWKNLAFLWPNIAIATERSTLNAQQHPETVKNDLIYANAKSLLKNFGKIETITYKHKPKIIMLSEARVTNHIAYSEYQLDGYNSIECFSENRRTGGVIIYILPDLKYKVILNSAIDKMIWFLAIEIWDSNTDGIYCIFYRSPSANVNIAIEALNDLLSNSINLNKFNLVAGDLNIDLNKKNNYSKFAEDLFIRHGLELNVNFNTRDNRINGTLIDVILTNKVENIHCIPLENEHVSDHKTIKVEVIGFDPAFPALPQM